MDISIQQEVTKKKRKKLLITTIAVLILLSIGVISLRTAFTSSIKKTEITTAVVEIGTVENTISASGEVLPEFEQVITSPVSASIQKVLIDAGSNVKQGQSILALDKATTQSEYEKIKFGLESKRNEIQKLKLELDKSFSDLQSNNDIKQLHINSLEASLEDAKRLYKSGGGTKEDIQQAELNLHVAQLEKKQLENEISSKQQTMRIEMKEAEIAAAVQENDLKELARKLQLADIVATRSGVVTWVNKNIGATVREGESLVRIADLGSFKVSGTVSDSYLDQLHNGMTAIVRINDVQLRGKVVNVNPSIQNNLISYDIQMDDNRNKLFRPNMKVDVFLVTSVHNNIMRVANGPAFKGALTQDIFIMNDKKAERRTVHIGLSNFDYVEVKDNVKPGDVVITSDMNDYKNVKEITIN